jgi:multicomponent Na+:H+ antiporter subunit E
MSQASADHVLVPVGDSVTLRNTVAYVVREALERAEGGARPKVSFVYPASWQRQDLETDVDAEAEELLGRVETWVREDTDTAEDEPLPIDVETELIGADTYLFSPQDYAELLLDYAREHGIDHIVLDPEFKPGPSAPMLTPLVVELERAGEVTHEEAPVERSVRGRRLLGQSFELVNFLVTFGVSYLFYLVLGGFAGTFDYATGAVSAGIVAAVLSSVTFDRRIRPAKTLQVLARWVLYVPYLLWEIAKANVQVVYIVLHPSLPIDPSMERFRPALPSGLPVTTLANSITLTPGTITVDVHERDFHVHALSGAAREGLFDGGLERAVRFVFFGRAGARIASPRERGQGEGEQPDSEAVTPETGEPEADDTDGGEES